MAPVYTRALPQVLSLEQWWLCSVPPIAVCVTHVLHKPWCLCLCCPAWHSVTRTCLLQSLFTPALSAVKPNRFRREQAVLLYYFDFCSCPLENCKLSLSQHFDGWNLYFWAYCIPSLECSHFKPFSFSTQNQLGLSNQLMHQSKSKWNWMNFKHSCR